MSLSHLRRPLYRMLIVAAIGFLSAACSPAKSAPPTSTTRPPAPTAVIIIVTLPPSPTVAPTLTATPFFDMDRIGGRWRLDLSYRLHGYPYFDDIEYSTSAALSIAPDGTITGAGTLQTTLQQPPCNAVVRAGGGLAFTVGGTVFKQGEAVLGDLTLTPQDLDDSQTFERLCTDPSLNLKINVSIVWSMLTAIDGFHFQVVLKQASSLSSLRDLSGPSGGILHGTLATDIRLFR